MRDAGAGAGTNLLLVVAIAMAEITACPEATLGNEMDNLPPFT